MSKRITIITGYYGTGKSEFSVNYAIDMSKKKDNVAIIDLDVINPYFRSREKIELFKENNVKLIGSSMEGNSTLDVPAVSPEIMVPLRNRSFNVIVDLGGDVGGIRVLRGFKGYFEEEDNYDIFYVLNARRPDNETVEKVLNHIKQLEVEIGLEITGIINNTHLSSFTTYEDVKHGNQISVEVSKVKNVPIVYNSVVREIIDDSFDDLEGDIFPLDITLRQDWMS